MSYKAGAIVLLFFASCLNRMDAAAQAVAMIEWTPDLAVQTNELRPPKLPVEFVLPVKGTITSPFSESRLHPILNVWKSHNGVDIGASEGEGNAALFTISEKSSRKVGLIP